MRRRPGYGRRCCLTRAAAGSAGTREGLESFSWGVSNHATAGAGSGGGAGKATFQDIHFIAHNNKATPYLANRVATGKPLADVRFAVHDSFGTELLMTYCAEKATVRRLEVNNIGSSGQDGVAIDLGYQKLSVMAELDLGLTVATFDLKTDTFSFGTSPSSSCPAGAP